MDPEENVIYEPEGHRGGLKNLFYGLVMKFALKPEEVLAEARRRGLRVEGNSLREQIESLQRCNIADLDALASKYINSSSWISGAQGFATGLPGLAALPLTLPTELLGNTALFVRVFSGVMLSYGYYFDTASEEGKALFLLELLAATGTDALVINGRKFLIQELSKKVINVPFGDTLILAALKQLGKKLGLEVSKGALLAKAVPIAGGIFGAGINLVSIQLLGRTARRHFHKLLAEDRRRRTPGWQLEPAPIHQLPPPGGKGKSLGQRLRGLSPLGNSRRPNP